LPHPSQGKVASKGRGILAMDESNATCGKRLQSIGLENTEDSRRAYRELLVTTPGLGQYISGAILFEETLFQKVCSLAAAACEPALACSQPEF
jgi:fructose-bisphosphate aldolase class I